MHGEDRRMHERNEQVIHGDIDEMYEMLNDIVQHAKNIDEGALFLPQSEYQADEFDNYLLSWSRNYGLVVLLFCLSIF